MVRLDRNNIVENQMKSSKGNQMKWKVNGFWYKADYTGYEGFAETVISKLLSFSKLGSFNFLDYTSVKIQYEDTTFIGCSSVNFLPDGWQLITLERLFKSLYGENLYQSIFKIESEYNRAKFIVDQTIRMTNLADFGEYLSVLMTIDAFFLNEDRHTHNIAVLLDEKGTYHYCPIFDNGASLLSDTTLDYPLDKDIYSLIKKVKAKTFSADFDIQLDVIEELYGQHVIFKFNKHDVDYIIDENMFYSNEIKNRVKDIVFQQMRKYHYLFKTDKN